jgi:hypothetical protein
MGFNYARGNQMFVNDPRLYIKQGENRLPVAPPNTKHKLTVMPGDPVENIMNIVAQYADLSGGKLDALHIAAHGAPGYVQLGQGVTSKNVKAFDPIHNKVKVIVVYSCNAGRDIALGQINVPGWSLGGGIAEKTNAKVIVCQEIQYFGGTGSTVGRGGLQFTDSGFEGDITICYPGGNTNRVFNDPRTGHASIDLEKYIFG